MSQISVFLFNVSLLLSPEEVSLQGLLVFFFVYYIKYVDNYHCTLNPSTRFARRITIFSVLYREVEEGGYFFTNILNLSDLC